MIKLNLMVLLIVISLLILLYINNSEHFGATDTLNPEAVRNISSVYNADNLTATNINVSNSLTSPNIKGNIKIRDINNKGINIGTNLWTDNPPDDASKQSAIVNETDNNAYKKLMIVGNSSSGGVRKVGIWDRLDVYGDICIEDVCINKEQLRMLRDKSFDTLKIAGTNISEDSGKLKFDRNLLVQGTGGNQPYYWLKDDKNRQSAIVLDGNANVYVVNYNGTNKQGQAVASW